MARTSRFAQQCQQGMQILSLVLIGVLLYQLCSSMKSTFPTSPWEEAQQATNENGYVADQPDTDVEEEEEE